MTYVAKAVADRIEGQVVVALPTDLEPRPRDGGDAVRSEGRPRRGTSGLAQRANLRELSTSRELVIRVVTDIGMTGWQPVAMQVHAGWIH